MKNNINVSKLHVCVFVKVRIRGEKRNDIFRKNTFFFGMKDIAKKQLKINKIEKMREQIICFKKYKGIFSAVLSILSFK